MEVRPGYKQTDVGLIPENWECARICDLARLESGHTPSRNVPVYWNGPIPWVSLHDTDSLDKNHIYDTAMSITQQGIDNSSARLLPAGTVVFSRTATVGKATILGREMATSQDFANYVCGPKLCNLYVVYLFRGMVRTWKSLMAGSTHKTIYMPTFEALKIPVPPISEQHRIVAALTDIDDMLAGLDRLIAKKRDLKQAAMQQLLTGKMRLPGYRDEWTTIRLEDHLSFLRHGVNSRAELMSKGQVKYLHYGDIHNSPTLLLNPNVAPMPYLPSAKASRLDRLADGDLVFADASEDLEGVGKSVELFGVEQAEVVSGLHTIVVRFNKQVLADGFKAYLQHIPVFRLHLLRLAAGTKVYATNRASIASAELALPGVKEQIAIASILADMDAETAALEARHSKTRLLKQAMMQELLTGRTRLL